MTGSSAPHAAGYAPSRHDPVVRAATRFIGGPWGDHAAPGRRGLSGVAATVVVLGSLMVAVGVLQKGYCLAYGWSDPDQFWRACYSDVAVVTVSSALAEGSMPYSGQSPSDQPVLSGLVLWVLTVISPASGGDVPTQRWTFGLWAVLATVLLALATQALVSLQQERPWQAAHLAVSPVIALLALISVDLVGILLVIWALWAWQRDRPMTSGALLGLAVLLRPFPLVFLLAAVFLAWRTGQRQHAVRVVASTAVTAAVAYAPFLALFGDGATLAPRRFLSSGPGYGGSTLVPSLFGAPVSTTVATVVALTGWVVAAAVGVGLSRRLVGNRDVRTLIALAAPMMLTVILTSKTVSVQTGLWMLPFLALSALPWRDHLLWAAAEVIHFEATWLYIGFGSDPGRGLPADAYGACVVLRAVAWTWVLARVWTRAGEAPGAYGARSSLPDVVPDSRSRWASATRSSG
ncbi:MAG TPA: glycosyltransferase 87 family protein [Ornithinimicrobium sp.]|uniref:glycosyltransferase 87 family protein n=1 Tax=Ornithinimicrobium sp. TaxID=1977084 RepID=UPI002B49F743|nr:glycosyltransferase 87 family protein [Ornithinimicrobium sp.]HKJ12950.1 glycosyltransferase 87 family protein [Ornithinimicrobium sp.]